MKDIIFHIGLHKTATTTLQRQVFSKWPGLVNASKSREVSGLVRALTTVDPIYFDADHWARALASTFTDNQTLIISREALSGALFAGVGKRGIDHRSSILDNLMLVAPTARIILVLRRQDTLARSIYRQYLNDGGTESIKEFYGIESARSPIFPAERFMYSPYVRHLHSLTSGRLLVLPFEELAAQSDAFLLKLGSFVGLDAPNVILRNSNDSRMGSLGMEVMRHVNRLFRSQLNPGALLPRIPMYRRGRLEFDTMAALMQHNWPIKGTIGKNSRIQRISDSILETNKDDNKILDEQFNLGLHKYGYY